LIFVFISFSDYLAVEKSIASQKQTGATVADSAIQDESETEG